jgi:hypothetical protein
MLKRTETTTHLSPCSFVCHGRCEFVMAKKIKSLLRLPISIYAESNGKSSIQIHTLLKYMSHQSSLYSREAYLKDNGVETNYANAFFNHHKIIFFMDLDDASAKEAQEYISGHLFSNEWYSSCVLPIFFRPNLDVAAKQAGYNINFKRDKPEQFELIMLRDDNFFINLAKTGQGYSNLNEALNYLRLD